MNITKVFRVSLISVVGFTAVLILVMALGLLFGLSINLNTLRTPISEAASLTLNRDFSIQGDVDLEISFWPTLHIENVSIANVEGFKADQLAKLDVMELKIATLPILYGEFHVLSFVADGIHLNLETDETGNNNWQLADKESKQVEFVDEPQHEKAFVSKAKKVAFELKDMSLNGLRINYDDRTLNKQIKFKLDSFSGQAGKHTELSIQTSGEIQNIPFEINVTGPSASRLKDTTQVSPLKVNGKLEQTPFDFNAEFSRPDNQPKLTFVMEIGQTDIGKIIESIGISQSIQASSKQLKLDATLSGNSLKKLLTQSSAKITLTEGEIKLGDKEKPLLIEMKHGQITISQSEPVQISLAGKLDNHDLAIEILGGQLIDYITRDKALPTKLDASLADASLLIDTSLTLPIESAEFDMKLNFKGGKLSTLNETFSLDLPPLGPLSLDSQLSLKKGYLNLSDLKLQIGKSQLGGRLKVDKTGEVPNLDLVLNSELIQINDFNLQGWSPEKKTASEPEKTETDNQQKIQAKASKARSILSEEVLNSFQANASIKAKQVKSGKDLLGSGEIVISNQQGKLSIDPLSLSIPGGSVAAKLSYRPRNDKVEIHLSSEIDRFDYGVLARRVNPETKMGGQLFLDMALDATAENIAGVFKTGKGHFDFALLPQHFDAAIFDLWAVNLLSAVSEKMDDEPTSTVNCILTRFSLEDGVMQQNLIFMDTTRMSVEGEAKIDFKQERITVAAKPEAKNPEFFSLAVPVKVTGSFQDWKIKLGLINTTMAGVNFIASPITTPIKRLFSSGEKLEGEAACRAAWQESEEEIKKAGNE